MKRHAPPPPIGCECSLGACSHWKVHCDPSWCHVLGERLLSLRPSFHSGATLLGTQTGPRGEQGGV